MNRQGWLLAAFVFFCLCIAASFLIGGASRALILLGVIVLALTDAKTREKKKS